MFMFRIQYIVVRSIAVHFLKSTGVEKMPSFSNTISPELTSNKNKVD